ncbi:MAG: rhombotarget lipoprotein [Pseudomonadota bacterium]
MTPNTTSPRTALFPLAVLTVLVLAGCSTPWLGDRELLRSGSSSSLVDYLYPDGEIPPFFSDDLPYLELPLRVGIAFVPDRDNSGISAAEKERLLEQVAEAFRDRPYVRSIETISDHYLRSAPGFSGLRQLAALHDVDVVALVSYDQLTLSGDRDSAIFYWTIVGTAVVKGNTTEVQTMIDTAVFDPMTATLLFRAPGVHSQQRNSTLLDAPQTKRELRTESFAAANSDMVANLDAELVRFEERVKDGEEAYVAWKSVPGGGGSSGAVLLGALGLLLLFRLHRT